MSRVHAQSKLIKSLVVFFIVTVILLPVLRDETGFIAVRVRVKKDALD